MLFQTHTYSKKEEEEKKITNIKMMIHNMCNFFMLLINYQTMLNYVESLQLFLGHKITTVKV